MHGIKKDLELPSEEELSRTRAKVAKYRALVASCLQHYHARDFTSKYGLERTAAALALNPENYTLWAYRRLTLNALSTDSPDLLTAELLFIQTALMRNPKVYSAWAHRRFVVQKLIADTGDVLTILNSETALTDKFLSLDRRNFHCWAYRRDLLQFFPAFPLESELAFSQRHIEDDFSNFSAWHHRRYLLDLELPAAVSPLIADSPAAPLDSELRSVWAAATVSPGDEAPWQHFLCLLDAAEAALDAITVSASKRVSLPAQLTPNSRCWLSPLESVQLCASPLEQLQANLLSVVTEARGIVSLSDDVLAAANVTHWPRIGLASALAVLVRTGRSEASQELAEIAEHLKHVMPCPGTVDCLLGDKSWTLLHSS
jgi:geranylgeranyl transferase type-2 subunit alpha